jgi:hypothetical protein
VEAKKAAAAGDTCELPEALLQGAS